MNDLFLKAVHDPPYTPRQMELDGDALLAELLPLRDAEKDPKKRKLLSSRIKAARILRDWAKTRAGYRA